MLKKIIGFCLLALLCSSSYGKELSVTNIPKELLKDAKAVIRYENLSFELNSESNAVYKVDYAITILNENGLYHSYFAVPYNKFSKVRSISGTIYDEHGEVIRKIRSDDIHDISAIQGFSLYEDNRAKIIDAENQTYPFTVQYSYEMHFSGILNFPDWTPAGDFNLSVQESKYTAIVPKGYNLRYYTEQLDLQPIISNGKNQDYYKWEIKNVKAIKDEVFGLSIKELAPVVHMAPSDFKIKGTKGNSSTWLDFGKWINELNKDRDSFSEEIILEINSLLKDCNDDFEKAEKLYKYMQDRTRYVNIAVGLGGWQPIEANRVHEVGYGDCKALSNYMKALLKVADIESFYAIIRAGENAPPTLEDFSCNSFNHAILAVPIENDTIWLECTSQDYPFGYIGTFTDDRKALLIKEDGGYLVKTKSYSIKESTRNRSVIVKLSENGNCIANISTNNKGIFYREIYQNTKGDSKDVKKRILDNLSIPSFQLNNYSYDTQKEDIPFIREDLEIEVFNHAKNLGNRLLLPVNLLGNHNDIRYSRNRFSDIRIRRSNTKSDTVKYIIPEGYSVQSLPEDIEIKSDFGSYTSNLSQEDNMLIYVRNETTFKGEYPASDFEKLTEYYEKIYKADALKVILQKQ